jgi:hypothetical protein
MMFCIDAAQLRRALVDIEAAEKNGFMHCLAVLNLTQAGPMLDDCRVEYSDLCERAHPTDGGFNWGRFQGVTRKNRFVNGKLVPIKQPRLRRETTGRKRARPQRAKK